MQFGKTYEEEKKINQEREKEIDLLRQWHSWFAWFPVLLNNGRYVWLETIERRRAHYVDIWFYREIGDSDNE